MSNKSNRIILWYVKTDSGYQIVEVREGQRGYEPFDDPAVEKEEGDDLIPVFFPTEEQAKWYCDHLNWRFSDDVQRIIAESLGWSPSAPPDETEEQPWP